MPRRQGRHSRKKKSPQPERGYSSQESPRRLNQNQHPGPADSPPRHSPKAKKPKRPLGTEPATSPDSRDLSAILAYGPGFLPYTAAWTDSRVEQVRAFKRWVFVAVNKICEALARKFPNVSYLETGDPGDYRARSDPDFLSRSHAKAFPSLDRGYVRSLTPATKLRHLEALKKRQKALTPLLSHESLQPLEHNHPFRRLLASPNAVDTSFTLTYETVMYFLLTGNAYWWLPRHEKTGLPEAIWSLPSHWVWPVLGKTRLLDGWELRPVEGNYLRQTLPAEEVIHFRHPNPISKIDGMAPLTALSQWADVSESIDRSRVMAFKNGMTPTIVVQFDGSLNDPSDEMLRRIDAKILSRYVGENRSNKPLYLPPGVKATPLSLKPNEMVWGENALETRSNILAGYNVPPGIVAAEPTTPEDRVTFCHEALNPLASFLGQTVSEKLCPLFSTDKRQVRYWYEDFVPDDPTHLEQTIKTDLLCGAVTPNEVRILRGRQPYPYDWADSPVLPVNMAPLSSAQGGAHQDPATLLGPNLPPQPELAPENPPRSFVEDSSLARQVSSQTLPGSLTSLLNPPRNGHGRIPAH